MILFIDKNVPKRKLELKKTKKTFPPKNPLQEKWILWTLKIEENINWLKPNKVAQINFFFKILVFISSKNISSNKFEFLNNIEAREMGNEMRNNFSRADVISQKSLNLLKVTLNAV